jgi:hypothetical protein
MAHTLGSSGLVTSWAGSPFNVAKFGPSNVSFSIDGEEHDATQFVAALEAGTFVPGLKTWQMQMSGNFPASGAKTGAAGNVTLSGYDLLVRAYSLSIEAASFDSTVFSASGVTWREFLGGLYRWNGSLEVGIDGTTALGLPPAPGGSAGSLTLKVTEDGGTDRAFTGSAFVRQTSGVIAVGALNTAQYAFRGTGELTSVGTDNLWAAAALDKPITGSLVWQAATGRTYTGDAFAQQITINVPVDGLISVSVTAQGTGALTPA